MGVRVTFQWFYMGSGNFVLPNNADCTATIVITKNSQIYCGNAFNKLNIICM